jgi:hypothetical protein
VIAAGGKDLKVRTDRESMETRGTDTVVGIDTIVNQVKEDAGNLSAESKGQELDDWVVGLQLLQLNNGVDVSANDEDVEEEVSEEKSWKSLLVEGQVRRVVPATTDGVGEVHKVVEVNTVLTGAVGIRDPPDVSTRVVSNNVATNNTELRLGNGE